MKECTICNLGISILPRIAVKDELERGKLVELNWSPPFTVKTQLLYHHEKWITPALGAFLELCNHSIQE